MNELQRIQVVTPPLSGWFWVGVAVLALAFTGTMYAAIVEASPRFVWALASTGWVASGVLWWRYARLAQRLSREIIHSAVVSTLGTALTNQIMKAMAQQNGGETTIMH
jgi:hypothetical protein